MSGTGGAAAVAILLLGLVMAVVVAQPSLDSAIKDLKDARESVANEMMEMRNTGITIVSALHNSSTSVLNLTVENSGSSVLRRSDVDILLNGTMVAAGLGAAGYIYPGQSTTLGIGNVTDPRSVKIVGPWGVSDTTTAIGKG
ncbi:MAG: hypothetical protein ACMUHY_03490 [Thermoplasmatota archaeon]